MAARKISKRALLAEHLIGVGEIDAGLWATLKRELAPISDSYLRTLLRRSGHPMSPLIEGVVTSTLAEAERTLIALAAVYHAAHREQARQQTMACRQLVIEAKQRLRWRLQREGDLASNRTTYQEILLWTSTWLENPQLFAQWASLRRKQFAIENRKPQL